MRGKLKIDNTLYENVHIENIGESDTIRFYQLNEDGKRVEVVYLQKVKYLITGEEVEITGFRRETTVKNEAIIAPLEGESYTCMNLRFQPDPSAEVRERNRKAGLPKMKKYRKNIYDVPWYVFYKRKDEITPFIRTPAPMEFESGTVVRGNESFPVKIRKTYTRQELLARGEFVYSD